MPLVAGFVDYEGDGAPDTEIILGTDPDARVIGIGRDQPALPVLHAEMLQRVFAIELAHRYLPRRRIPVALVHDDNVPAEYPGVNH